MGLSVKRGDLATRHTFQQDGKKEKKVRDALE